MRLRPGDQPAVPPIRQRKMSARKIAVAKQPTVVLSMPLTNLRRNEQVLVHGRVRADARPLGYHARLSARMFLADGPADLDPAGKAKAAASWKGNLSKENGFNCLRNEGPSAREKFGVARILADTDELWVNVVATSSAPFEPNRTPGHKWPLATGSFIEVRRYGPELFG